MTLRRARPFKAALFCPELFPPGGMEKFAVLMAQTLREEGCAVELVTDLPARRGRLDRAFGSSLHGIPVRVLGPLERCAKELVALTARCDLFVNHSSAHSFPSFARQSWLWAHYLPRAAPRYLDFYRVFANSRHTQRWIRRSWGAPAGVLYGPVHVERLKPLAKEKIILSAGRLHALPIKKNELEMIRVFGGLHRAGKLPGWSYHIAGISEPPDRAWLARVKAAAAGLPVQLHLNPSFDELADLYGRASLLWHGAGAGVPQSRPDRVEHFGIVIVEAMAAGCVPLAPDAGGPREIVSDGRDGFLYRTWEELARKTLDAAADRARLAAMGARARAAAGRFGVESFRRELRRLIAA
ncbi:MAG: glycosyltransferase [Elusimicrobia bacterium]|nr:glycosyltransferase [Elusimicrobiota bacterium]